MMKNDTVSGRELEEAVALEEASGGAKKKPLSSKKQELEASMGRSEEILKILTGYEEGNHDNVKDIMHHLKTFVLQTTEQQRQMKEKEIALEEQRMREAEENIERKKRLEKLLINLNERLKKGQESTTESLRQKSERNLERGKKAFEPTREEDIGDSGEEDRNTKIGTNQFSPVETMSESSLEEYQNARPRKEKREKRKKKDQRRDKIRSLSKANRIRKRHRKVSFSSISTSSSSSSTSSSSEMTSDSNSESSSVSSVEERHKKKKHRKERKARKSLRRIPVSEWKLKYDGRDQGRRLAEFLKEVKMRCKSEDISERELFRGAIHFFSGRTKDWFMEGFENRDFRTWSGLKRKLKCEFLPPDLDFQIEIQATNRRQARGEKFVDYLHDMQKLFQSMTKPISDQRKFEIGWRNMRYDYKNALTGAGIRSLSRLKKYGRIIDENNWNMFQKSSESRSKVQLVNEMTASSSSKLKQIPGNGQNSRSFSQSKPKQSSEGEKIKQRVEQNEGKAGKSKEDPMEGSSKGTLRALSERYVRPPIGTCYNCRKHGHHYGDCSEKRKKFCRLCGFLDVITPECPFCQKNEQSSA